MPKSIKNRPRKCLGMKTPNQVFFGDYSFVVLWTWIHKLKTLHTAQTTPVLKASVKLSWSTRLPFGGFSNPETFTHPNTHPVILRGAESGVAESIIQHNPRHPGERGPSKTMVEGQTKTLFLTPHPPWRAPSPQEKGVPSLIDTVDSATPGKPCVQNDMWVRWKIGRWNQFIKV